MKNYIYLFAILILLQIVSINCNKNKIGQFNSLIITDNVDLKIKQANKVELISDDDDPEVSYSLNNHILTITGNGDATLYLPDFKNLKNINIDENAELEADDDLFYANDLNISMNVDADAQIKLSAQNLTVNLDDNSTLQLKGEATSVNLTTTKNAKYKGHDLTAKSYNVDISDNSEAHVYAQNSIKGIVKDNAHLYYSGLDASKINVEISDNGTILSEGGK